MLLTSKTTNIFIERNFGGKAQLQLAQLIFYKSQMLNSNLKSSLMNNEWQNYSYGAAKAANLTPKHPDPN